MLKKLTFLILLGLLGFQENLSAQAPTLQKNDILSNLKLRTWYGFNTLHSTKVLDVERVISENEFEELKTLRTFFRDTLTFQCLKTDIDGIQKVVSVSLVLSSEFMCAVETWNTACGFPNGRIIIYIVGGDPKYYVSIRRNSDGVEVFKDNGSNTKFEKLDLKADTYKVWVYDSKPAPDVPNEYILNAAEVKNSSAPEVSLTPYPAPCGQNGKIESFTQKGVGPYTYKWSNGATTKDLINVPAGNYTLTVSDANFCTDVASAKVEGTNGFTFSLDAKNASCRLSNGSIVPIISGGTWPYTYQWSNGATTKDLLNVSAGNYAVTITDALGCKQTGMKTIFAIQRKDSFYIHSMSCNPVDTGTFFLKDTVSFRTGCDSVTFKRVGYAPKGDFTFEIIKTACSFYKNRVDSFKTKSLITGCDSTHVISWNYVGISTRYNLTRDTCVFTPDKIDVVKSLMCGDDSIYYVTHFRVLPSDTIRLTESWCKSRNSDTTYFLNKFGCTSMKVVSYSVKPLDTVFVTKDTCYKAMKNSYYMNLKTKDGFCDSVVLMTLNVLKTDTLRSSLYVCGLKISKQSKQVIPNHLGCDSLTILIDSLAPPAIVRSTVFRYSCDQDSVKQGTYFDTTYFNYGCIKSIITLRLRDAKTTTDLKDTVLINQNIDTIIFVSKTLVNQYNCDSVVNRKWIYDKAEIYWIPEDSTNCGSKPSETILVQKLKTHYGSDSLVKRKLITFESPKLKVDDYSHPTSKWNGSIDLSVSKGKGPWNLYDEKGNEIDFERSNLKGGLYHAIVVDDNGCWDSLAVGLSDFWAYTSGRTIHLHGGLADDDLVNNYYGGEFGTLEIIDSRGHVLFTKQNVNMRMEFDEKFQISETGMYYAKISFPNQPGAYLFSKAVIQ